MLTKTQCRTLEFIKKFCDKHDYSPTTAEIADGIGISSRGVVYRYLKALSDAGEIELVPGKHRNIQLLSKANNDNLFEIPLLGSIAAGQPIEAINSQESISVTDIFSGPHRYALRVKGDSMIEEGIFDGDTVVCEHAQTARNGQIIVALIDQNEATLKRIRYENDKQTITLLPANASYKPMHYPADRVKVQGIYIGLIRMAH